MKAYTDIEQSRRLKGILPPESADMCWEEVIKASAKGMISDWAWEIMPHEPMYKADIPCWSLAALLQMLPLGIYDELDDSDYELKIDMADKMPRYVRLGDVYHSQFPYDFGKDTLLDNVVESIIWLNDNNYFKVLN